MKEAYIRPPIIGNHRYVPPQDPSEYLRVGSLKEDADTTESKTDAAIDALIGHEEEPRISRKLTPQGF